MSQLPGVCPLTTRNIIDEYFIENRTKLLDLAAFLDRLDRSFDGAKPEKDFRMRAFQHALEVLCDSRPFRLKRVQEILSDPTTVPREQLDRKSASGAFDDGMEAR